VSRRSCRLTTATGTPRERQVEVLQGLVQPVQRCTDLVAWHTSRPASLTSGSGGNQRDLCAIVLPWAEHAASAAAEGQRHERRAGARLAPFLPSQGRIW